MRPRNEVLHPGTGELLKGGVHAFLGGVLSVVFAFNTAAWVERRQRHLAVNAIGYGIAVGWECYQTWLHFREEPPPSRGLIEVTCAGDRKRSYVAAVHYARGEMRDQRHPSWGRSDDLEESG